MRFLHIADVHLGRRARQFGDFAGTLREEIERALERALNAGAERGAQLVLVAGDLFDSKPSKKRVAWLFRAVEELRVPFIVLPGTHGHDRSVYDSPAFENAPSNFHVLRGSGCRLFQPPGLYVCYDVERPLEFPSPPADLPGVGVAHGSVDIPSDEAETFSSSDFARTGVRYLALGHWHGTKEVSAGGVAAWYPGPPEAFEWKGPEEAKGAAILVELGEKVTVERLEVGRYRWRKLDLDVDLIGEEGVRENLVRLGDEDCVAKVDLRGAGEDLARALREELSGSFAFLELKAHPRKAFSAPAPMKGTLDWHFVELMEEKLASAGEDERAVLQEALELGRRLVAGEEDLL